MKLFIQGDVSDEVIDMLEEANAKGPGGSSVSIPILAGVPPDNVVVFLRIKKKVRAPRRQFISLDLVLLRSDGFFHEQRT